MSDIRVDTISAANGTDPVTLTKQSAAKAWVTYYNNAGPAIRESSGISSITDIRVGTSQVDFTSSFTSVHYSATALAGFSGTSTAFCTDVDNRASASFQMNTRNVSNTSIDCNRNSVTFHGDLA